MKQVLLISILLLTAIVGASIAGVPQTINYQGRVTDSSGDPHEGPLILRFAIYDVSSGGDSLWSSGFHELTIVNGLFSYTLGTSVLLPPSLFTTGADLYLGIKVGTDPEIEPRTKFDAVPYAYQAVSANSSDSATTVSDNAINSMKIQDGSVQFSDIGQNDATSGQVMKWNGAAWLADNDSVGGGSNWTLTDSVLYTTGKWGIARGEAGNALIGDSTHTHVNFGVACTTGISVADSYYATVSGGFSNRALGDYSTIGGGIENNTSSYSVVSGGFRNRALGDYSAIGGGFENSTSGIMATVGGGQYNLASAPDATVSGGLADTASGSVSTVSGGLSNSSTGDSSTVGGGSHNTAVGAGSTVGGGSNNIAETAATVGGGTGNSASSLFATIGGGRDNLISGEYSAILGGYADTITATADSSYLFGIGSKLTQPATFMVDMPHIRFGDEVTGYEIPDSDGTSGQVLTTDGSGQASWQTPTAGETGIVPIGSVVAWMKSLPGTPSLDTLSWVECNGQTLNHPENLFFHDQVMPDLNISNRFLRGSGNSGSTGGADSHTHGLPVTPANVEHGSTFHLSGSSTAIQENLPSYYEVVWIMRIK